MRLLVNRLVLLSMSSGVGEALGWLYLEKMGCLGGVVVGWRYGKKWFIGEISQGIAGRKFVSPPILKHRNSTLTDPMILKY